MKWHKGILRKAKWAWKYILLLSISEGGLQCFHGYILLFHCLGRFSKWVTIVVIEYEHKLLELCIVVLWSTRRENTKEKRKFWEIWIIQSNTCVWDNFAKLYHFACIEVSPNNWLLSQNCQQISDNEMRKFTRFSNYWYIICMNNRTVIHQELTR